MGRSLRVVTSARKGGSGKTVLTVLAAWELAKQGASVLVVDLDPQSVGSGARLGANVKAPLGYTAIDLVRGSDGRRFSPQEIIPGLLDVVASNQADVVGLEVELSMLVARSRMATGSARRLALDAQLGAVESAYDVVLIDTPTGFGEITSHAIEAASLVMSPIDVRCSDTVESVHDLDEHLAALERHPPAYFIPNMVGMTIESRLAMRRAQEICGERCLVRMALPKAEKEIPTAMSHRRAMKASSPPAVRVMEAVYRLGQWLIDEAATARQDQRGDGAVALTGPVAGAEEV